MNNEHQGECRSDSPFRSASQPVPGGASPPPPPQGTSPLTQFPGLCPRPQLRQQAGKQRNVAFRTRALGILSLSRVNAQAPPALDSQDIFRHFSELQLRLRAGSPAANHLFAYAAAHKLLFKNSFLWQAESFSYQSYSIPDAY